MRARSTLGRVASIATAILLLVCMLVVQSREAAMVHVRCTEHGQLMHVDGVASEQAPAPSGVAAVTPSDGAPIDHDHCALIGAKHCVQLAVAPPVATIALAIAPAPRPDPIIYIQRATFRIAPKNSPPV